jgi:hypothetical protein
MTMPVLQVNLVAQILTKDFLQWARFTLFAFLPLLLKNIIKELESFILPQPFLLNKKLHIGIDRQAGGRTRLPSR